MNPLHDRLSRLPRLAAVAAALTVAVALAACGKGMGAEHALLTATATGKDVFVIGGASIYAAARPYCQRFYLTRIGMPFAGDTLFPESIPLARWTVISDVRKTFVERKSGRKVECRFLQYAQPHPRPLPAGGGSEQALE